MTKAIRKSMVIFLCAAMLCGIVLVGITPAASATEYYDDYYDVSRIYDLGDCPSMQGFTLDANYLYCAKINTTTETSAIITRTSKSTGDTIYMTDSATGSNYFSILGHANDLEAFTYDGSTHLLVSCAEPGTNSMVRYRVNGTKLVKFGNYTLTINGSQVGTASVQVMSIENNVITLLAKYGRKLYTGTIAADATSGTIALTLLCTLNVSEVTIDGTVKDLSNFLNQGMEYYDGKLYMPMSGNTIMDTSCILIYDIVGASGTIKNDPKQSIWIVSTSYPALFEIESCGIDPYTRRLYFNTNRRLTSSSTNYDGVHYVMNYTYDPAIDTTDAQIYRWETVNDSLQSVTTDGAVYNAAMLRTGTISDGAYSGATYSLDDTVILEHDRPWIVEWKWKGTGGGSLLFSESAVSNMEGNYYIYRRKGSSLLAFGEYSGGQYLNYGIDLSNHGIDVTVDHVYRMVNRINADGTNMVDLYVDGVKLGAMNNYFIAGDSQGSTSNWISGKDFEFSYIGTTNHPIYTTTWDYLQVWADGAASYIDEPNTYRWETVNNAMTSVDQTGITDNAATVLVGSCTDGVYSGMSMQLEKSVVLLHDRPWSIEWESTGAWTGGPMLLSATKRAKNEGGAYIYRRANSDFIALGTYSDGNFHNYGVKLSDHGINGTVSHVYRLTNRIEADGSNMVYLYVDGNEVGALNNYYLGGTSQGTTSDWVSGKDFTFRFMGTERYSLTDCSIPYMQIWENGVPADNAPKSFRWETRNDVLTSVATEENALNNAIVLGGSCADGVYTGSYFRMEESVELLHDRPWSIRWQSEGTWKDTGNGAMLLSASTVKNDPYAPYLYRRGESSIIAFGERADGHHNNYGIMLSDYGIDGTAAHTYELVNRVNSDGSNMVYLYVDGVELGAMNNYFVGGTAQGTTSDWISGKDFLFSYIGTPQFTLGNCSMEYFEISEGSAPKYTVEFRNWDGTVLSSAEYTYGDTVTVPASPTRPTDNTYTYAFAGWDQEVVPCNGDAVYTATYDARYIDYTVEFKNWDGTTLSSATYHYGDVVTAPADPTRSADDTYEYVFAGWDQDITVCTGDAVYTATYTAQLPAPVLTGKSFSLSFEDEVYVNFYFTVDNDNAVEIGMLMFSSQPAAADYALADTVYADAVYDETTGRYMAQTDGIAAKEMGDTRYYAAYAKLSNGTYAYSKVYDYSPMKYAMNMLGKDTTSAKQKALCVAMLNYGAEAQKYFSHRTDALMNASLTEEQRSLVQAYSADMFKGAVAADSSKAGVFVKTDSGFSKKTASVSFEGAFAINYYFTPDSTVDDTVTFYYWTAEDYAAAETLTVANASGKATMVEADNGSYWAQIPSVAAKQMDDTYYVAAVYTSNVESRCTGVVAYSLSKYCMGIAADETSAMQDLAAATAVYGYYAAQYFA